MKLNPILCRICLTLVACALIAAPHTAFAQTGEFNVAISPDPAVTQSRNPAYFDYAVPAGTVIEDALLVANRGAAPVEIVLFAADAATAANGGISFPGEFGDVPARAGAWLTLSTTRFTLQPGESRSAPFTLAVPADASGERAAGIVVQPAAPPAAATGQFGVTILQRTAVTVLVRIPGDDRAGLAVNALTARAGAGSQVIAAELENTGAIGVRSEGRMTIAEAEGGAVVADLPISLGYFLAGDTIQYEVILSPTLPAGDYDVALRLAFPGGAAARTARVTLESPQPVAEVLPDGTIVPPERGIPPLYLIAGGGVIVVLLAVVLALAAQVRQLRRERDRRE